MDSEDSIEEKLDQSEQLEGLEKLERIEDKMLDEEECLHEALEQSKMPNHMDGAHALSCPCPKCTPRC